MSNLHLTMRINGVQAFPAGLAVQFSPCSAVANNGGLNISGREKGSLFPTGVFLIRENKYTNKNKKTRMCKASYNFQVVK